jgi:hypothetical protein
MWLLNYRCDLPKPSLSHGSISPASIRNDYRLREHRSKVMSQRAIPFATFTLLLLLASNCNAQNAPGGINQGPNSNGTVNNYNNYNNEDRPDLGNICYTQFGGYTNPTYLGLGVPCSVNINGRIYPGFIGVAGHHPRILPLPQ